jgi:hypothetical protein
VSWKVVDPEELLERLGIVFENRGDTLWSRCPHPDHNDRTPSWRIIVDPDHPKYTQHRCYGCGWGGWPVHLVESVLGCGRAEAVAWLRDIEQNPPLPFEVNVDFQRSMTTFFKLPFGVKFGPLASWPEDARAYVEGRGITAHQVDRWKIGYATGRYHPELNPLAERIVFSVRDRAGKLLGYTGRSYSGSERRYKEPSKREGADLGAVFGEEHWPAHRKVVIVTEGAIDALAIERSFPSLAVGGIYGSQLHPGHIARLSTFEFVLMCSDPDKAGNAVASELAAQLCRCSRVVRVVLPEGFDAADLAIEDPNCLRAALDSALRVVHGDGHRGGVADEPRPRRRRTQVRLAGE